VVLDSSVLVGYERVKSPGAVMHETQSWVSGWLLEGVQLLIPAVSMATAAAECAGELPEVDYLLTGDPGQVLVVPLVGPSAVEVGAAYAAGEGKELTDFEVAHVVWCATGHDDDRSAPAWPVATYWPDWYAEADVPIIPL
jgi:hypothetical protein